MNNEKKTLSGKRKTRIERRMEIDDELKSVLIKIKTEKKEK